MSMHVHHLTGCAPAPLAHYLKALGILRLVAEQKDPTARLWWQDEHALLATTLNEEKLRRFFLEEYAPSPLVAPWNGGSGFYPGDNRKPVDEIVTSSSVRTQAYRSAIALAREVVKDRPERPANQEKFDMLQAFRRLGRGALAGWMECAVVLDANGDPAYPSLLGTGGNDGRLDFTINFMQHLGAMFNLADMQAVPVAPTTLDTALFARTPARILKSNAIGQFLPGNAGGANATTGYSGDSGVNSWDFILMLEGAFLFAAALSRRMQTDRMPLASAPFAMHGTSAGHGSAATGESAPRGEQWLPLWLQPATCADIRKLFAEGRFCLEETAVTRSMDAARALGRLGVARGICAFDRVAFLERNGQANFAIPLARWAVRAQPNRSLSDHAAAWIDRLTMKVRSDEHAPASWKSAARRCDEALLATCRNGRDARTCEELLLAMGAAEALLAQTPKKAGEASLHPLCDLPAEWVKVLPPSPELRLAVALAGLVGSSDDGHADYKQPVRIHFLPFAWDQKYKSWNTHSFAAPAGPERVATTGHFLRDASAIVRRRLHAGRFALRAGYSHYASLSDLAAFLRGDLDEARILALARPLMALKWQDAPRLPPPKSTADDKGVLALYGVLRLAHMPVPFDIRGTEYRVKTDPAIVQRLLGGDAAAALTLAARRLNVVGLRPYVRAAIADGAYAQRLAAALVFPIHTDSAAWLATTLCHASTESQTTTQEGVHA
jgi:CRISPR-associated protein Csx17